MPASHTKVRSFCYRNKTGKADTNYLIDQQRLKSKILLTESQEKIAI